MTVHMTEEDIKSFQSIYKKRYGKDISKEEAYKRWLALLQLMEIVLVNDIWIVGDFTPEQE